MQGNAKEVWMSLCTQVADEKDPAKFLELIAKINEMVEEKEQRLGISRPRGVF